MSASLMTLLEASLVQQRASDAAVPSKMTDPTVTYRGALRPVEPELRRGIALAPARVDDAADTLQELVAAFAKLADVDRMLEQVQLTVPTEDVAAQKWYQVSLTSLQWTRKAQSERVQTMLKELKSVILASKVTAVGQVTTPTSNPDDAGLPSHIPKEIICDVSGAATDVAEVHDRGENTAQKRLHDLRKVGSLRNDLETLRERDPDCCLLVRNIKRLGLESEASLRSHFARFGEVADVYCAHSFEKPSAKRRHGRVRPAALGFVVMASKEGAEKALAAGNDQTIGDVRVTLRPMGPFVEDEPQDTD